MFHTPCARRFVPSTLTFAVAALSMQLLACGGSPSGGAPNPETSPDSGTVIPDAGTAAPDSGTNGSTNSGKDAGTPDATADASTTDGCVPVITEFAIPSGTTSTPSAIASGPDGNLWFTEFNC